MQGDSRDPGPSFPASSTAQWLRKGRPQVWVCPEVRMLQMASLRTPTGMFPLSLSIKHLLSEYGTVHVTNTPQPLRILACVTFPPAPGGTCVSSSKCNLQWDLPCPAGRAGPWRGSLLQGTKVSCSDICPRPRPPTTL